GLPALLADAASHDESSFGGLRYLGSTTKLSARAVGLRLLLRDYAPLCVAFVPVENRNGAARGRLATEPGVHRLHLPGAIADRLGAGPRGSPSYATPLVLSLDRSVALVAGGRPLRTDRLLHAVHELERRVESVRTARVSCAGSLLRDVRPVLSDYS